MAEENLEGMDDLDSLLDDDAGGGGEEGDFAGELDDFLSDESGGDKEVAADDGDGGDSELDSFFEDLSTIDDLEVVQEEEEPAAAEEAPAAEPAVEPVAAVAAAAVAAPVAAAVAAAPRERRPPGKFRRRLKWIVLLALLGVGGYFAYITFFPDFEVPWPEVDLESIKELSPFGGEEKPAEEPPAEQPPVEQPPPPRAPVAAPPVQQPTLPPGSGYGVQVATCFFNSCVEGYQNLLKRSNRGNFLKENTTKSESLEIISRTTFTTRQAVDEMAAQINREHRLEGHAYTARAGNAFKISMGTFPDLARANAVKDELNKRLGGEVVFTSKLKTVSYSLRRVITGRFASREDARREMQILRKLDRRYRGAFVVRN